MSNLKKRLPVGFLIFVMAVCSLLFTSELVNNRFWLNDFKVYYLAAKSFLEGQQIYGIHFGLDSGFYKYSPFVLLIFVPFTLIPYKIACIIYYSVTILGVLSVFYQMRGFAEKYFGQKPLKYPAWILSVVFVFILNHLYRELHLGNTNIILLLLVLLTLKLTFQSKYFAAGVLFSLILLFKPFFFLLVIPFIIHKKYRLAIGAMAFMMFQAFVLIVILGWNKFYSLHLEWMQTIFSHSSSFPSGNNIEYLVRHFITGNLPDSFGLIVLLAIVLLFTLFFVLRNVYDIKNNNHHSNDRNLLLECFLIIAILPSILNTDTEHFLYSLPLIVLITIDVFDKRKPLFFILLFLIFAFYGLNSNDIVGKTIGGFYNSVGAVGISNLLLVTWGCFLYFMHKKTPSTEAEGVSSR
ncbi:MAG: glycosyltransferase family 87 protein [Bacteroidota bacterium]